MRYLESLHLGLIGWAIDSTHGQLVKDHVHFLPTTLEDCNSGTGSGGKLLANYPKDLQRL